jgi:hypothetical protein
MDAGHVNALGRIEDRTGAEAVLEQLRELGAGLGPMGLSLTLSNLQMPYADSRFAGTRAGITEAVVGTIDLLLPAYEKAYARLNVPASTRT